MTSNPGSIYVLPEGVTPKDVVYREAPDAVVREAMNHYYARDAQSLEQLIRRLIHKSQQP